MSGVVPFARPGSDRAALLELANGLELMRQVVLEMSQAIGSHATALRGLTARLDALECRMGRAEQESRPRGFCADRPYRRQRIERRLIRIRNRTASVLCVYLPTWSPSNAASRYPGRTARQSQISRSPDRNHHARRKVA